MRVAKFAAIGISFWLFVFVFAVLVHVLIDWPPPIEAAQNANGPLLTSRESEHVRVFTTPSNYDVLLDKQLSDLLKESTSIKSILNEHLLDKKQEIELAVIKVEMQNMREQLDNSIRIQWGIASMFLVQVIAYFFNKFKEINPESKPHHHQRGGDSYEEGSDD